MSKLLDCLGVQYKLFSTPKDGNCFYHATSHQLGGMMSHIELRQIVSAGLNADDLYLYNTIHQKNYTIKTLKRLVAKPNYIWADEIEINVLTRLFPKIAFLIFDDEYNVVNKIQHSKKPNKFICLHRKHEHYQSTYIHPRDISYILKNMNSKASLSCEANSSISSIFWLTIIFPSIVLVNFINGSL